MKIYSGSVQDRAKTVKEVRKARPEGINKVKVNSNLEMKEKLQYLPQGFHYTAHRSLGSTVCHMWELEFCELSKDKGNSKMLIFTKKPILCYVPTLVLGSRLGLLKQFSNPTVWPTDFLNESNATGPGLEN